MARKREWFTNQRNWTCRHRNGIAYGVILLALLGALAGWALLPDMVTMQGSAQIPAEDVLMRPKNTMILIHLGMTGFFTALFYKWPRELAYVFGMAMGLFFTYALLIINLVP